MPIATFHKLFQGNTPIKMISFTQAKGMLDHKQITKQEFLFLTLQHAVCIGGHWYGVDKML